MPAAASAKAPAGGGSRNGRRAPLLTSSSPLLLLPSRPSVPLPQGIVYGKPVNQGVTQLKPTRNLQNVAEERIGRKCGGLRVLNSYWVNQVRTRGMHALQSWAGVELLQGPACSGVLAAGGAGQSRQQGFLQPARQGVQRRPRRRHSSFGSTRGSSSTAAGRYWSLAYGAAVRSMSGATHPWRQELLPAQHLGSLSRLAAAGPGWLNAAAAAQAALWRRHTEHCQQACSSTSTRSSRLWAAHSSPPPNPHHLLPVHPRVLSLTTLDCLPVLPACTACRTLCTSTSRSSWWTPPTSASARWAALLAAVAVAVFACCCWAAVVCCAGCGQRCMACILLAWHVRRTAHFASGVG